LWVAQFARDTPGTAASQFKCLFPIKSNQFSSPGRYLSLLFIATAGLLASIIMLRSNMFTRATAYVGMLAAALDLAYCLAVVVMPVVDREQLALCFIPAAGLCLMIWHILIGQRLYRQGCLAGKTQPRQL
jgi:hypothetical protein